MSNSLLLMELAAQLLSPLLMLLLWWQSTLDRVSGPQTGETMVIFWIISSTVGKVHPVPWAATCVHPPICCSWIDEKFCNVRPCLRSSWSTLLTVAPAPTVTSFLSTSTTHKGCSLSMYGCNVHKKVSGIYPLHNLVRPKTWG